MASAQQPGGSQSPSRRAEFGWPGGDRPGNLQFDYEIDAELSHALGSVIEGEIGDFTSVRALGRPDGAAGRYAVTGADGREWFVRVSARWGEPKVEQAITGYLQGRGLPVNHLEAAGLRLEWHGGTVRVDVRARVHGWHFDGSLDDLSSLARTLADCHAALRECPQAGGVRALAAVRFTKFEETRGAMKAALSRGEFGFFCQEDSWARANAPWLARLVEGFRPRCDLLPGSQCLHGQIHQANVLYAPGPILLDWEEAVQTYAPAQWDLAYFVQRFCLYDDATPDTVRARLAEIRRAYGAPLGDLAAMMQHVAWLSAVVLVQYHQSGIESPLAEYAKFVLLEEQAREWRPLLMEFAA
jgi:hypothetical protein